MSSTQQKAQVELSQGDRNGYNMLGKQEAGTPDEIKMCRQSDWKWGGGQILEGLECQPKMIRFYPADNGGHRRVVSRRAQSCR